MFGEILGSIAGPVLGAMMQGDSAGDAVSAQEQATAQAVAEQQRQFNLNRADLQPWRKTGGQAATRLGQLLGLGENVDPSKIASGPIDYQSELFKSIRAPILQRYAQEYGGGSFDAVPAELRREAYGEEEAAYQRAMTPGNTQIEGFGDLNKKFTLADFWDDPVTKASFQFGLDEGTKALDRMSGARGMRNSGQAVKALTRFGTDYTGQKAGESYNRFYGDQDRTFNRLAGVSGMGQTAAQNTASMGQGTANNVSSLISGMGNARGAAAIAGGNAWGNAGNSISNYFGQQSTLDKILGKQNSFNPWANGGSTWMGQT